MIRRIPVAAALIVAATLSATAPAEGRRGARFQTVVDPACLASVPWFVDPASADMRLSGCRPRHEIPAPDAEGWIHYSDPNGASIDVHRDVVWDRRSGAITFRVRYNGGGSLSSLYTISGQPVVDGVLKTGSFTVK